jgi:intraflagellar transport protein 81
LSVLHGVPHPFLFEFQLEKVSAVKSELDDVKGKTLEEISEMVQRIKNTIAAKKNQLAPLVADLRKTRMEVQEIEVRSIC